eukprot:CAMPEP_0195512202 /NCGR_PEP_ID=MMETSP0794_2-20130614/4233_1 /TAXON_ID=515487 /ORGANISM="Stephanopyxis turris, Strain CCMP 815" /LENGTH=116 /DNA_ID=CAMNT_0040639931 /DNA_START=800 /DNA_END=1150 /DNA_ORIENTATION=-
MTSAFFTPNRHKNSRSSPTRRNNGLVLISATAISRTVLNTPLTNSTLIPAHMKANSSGKKTNTFKSGVDSKPKESFESTNSYYDLKTESFEQVKKHVEIKLYRRETLESEARKEHS